MFGIGGTELLLIGVIALLVFGPKRLPDLARSLGKGLAEFRRASSDLRRSMDFDFDERKISAPEPDDEPPAQAGSPALPTQETTPPATAAAGVTAAAGATPPAAKAEGEALADPARPAKGPSGEPGG